MARSFSSHTGARVRAIGDGRKRVQGDRAFRGMLKRLPDSMKEEMADALDQGGTAILAAMQADAPRRTGALAGGLSKRLARGAMRLRVGFIGKPVNRRLFYGRIVQFGRKSQTVMVQRRGSAAVASFGKRLRRGRKVTEDIVTTYRVRVTALPARPFVYSERIKQIRETLGGALNRFWDKVLTKASSGVGDE